MVERLQSSVKSDDANHYSEPAGDRNKLPMIVMWVSERMCPLMGFPCSSLLDSRTFYKLMRIITECPWAVAGGSGT